MKKRRAAEHRVDLDPAGQLELALLKGAKFLQTRVRPHLTVIAGALLGVVLIALITVAIRSSSRATAMRGFTMLTAAETTDELAAVAKEYGGTGAGEQARIRLARLFYDEGKFAQAATRYSLFCKECPASPSVPAAKLGEAYALEADGKLVQAEKRFAALGEDALKLGAPEARLHPSLAYDAYRGAARCAKTQGKLAVAQELYEKALACVGDDEAEKERTEKTIKELERLRNEPVAAEASADQPDTAESGEAEDAGDSKAAVPEAQTEPPPATEKAATPPAQPTESATKQAGN